jgi:hypothetical protein
MRKLLFLLFIPFTLQAQNVVSVSYSVVDRGWGVKYDRLFDNVGLYVAPEKGTYHLLQGTVSHMKIATGILVKFNPGYEYNPFFSLGFAYHKFWGEDRLWNIEKRTFEPMSLEFGVGNCFNRVNIGFRLDVIKNEGTIDLGYKF